jgi:type I restriction enzyme S subunit
VEPNDVLICRLDGPVGRACLAPDLGVRMVTSVDNTILKVRDGVDGDFLVYFMSSDPWLSWIETLCRVGGGFRFRISRTMLGDLRIPLPDIGEQRAIVAHITAETAKLDALREATERTLGLLKERRAALIAAAVTGELRVPLMPGHETAANSQPARLQAATAAESLAGDVT